MAGSIIVPSVVMSDDMFLVVMQGLLRSFPRRHCVGTGPVCS